MGSSLRKTTMPMASEALPGRPQALAVAAKHFVNGNRIAPPLPAGHEVALFGMGCFWGLPGVWSTSAGYAELPKAFWENHDPTLGMRQGNDVGTRYRSAIYASDDVQLAAARASKADYQQALSAAGHRAAITTEVVPAPQSDQVPGGSAPGSGSGRG